LSARILFKDLGETEKLTKVLADVGLQAKVRTWQYPGRGPYYFVELDQTSVLRLAENNQEWRYALNQIAQKYRKQL
jgi:ABC-type transport system substrate-binding protein